MPVGPQNPYLTTPPIPTQ